MFKAIAVVSFCAATLCAVPALAADSNSEKLKMNDNGNVANQPGGKTSDRTPNSSSPDRGAGAGTSGAAGTGAAKTPQGTSTRTPDDSKGRSMD